jgi:hypothetical protein
MTNFASVLPPPAYAGVISLAHSRFAGCLQIQACARTLQFGITLHAPNFPTSRRYGTILILYARNSQLAQQKLTFSLASAAKYLRNRTSGSSSLPGVIR